MSQNFLEYPIFEPNQVLSADHLNDLQGYLEEQSKLTRNKTIGIGIVCGLEPTYNNNTNTLYLSAGTAITSAGELIQTEALSFKFFRRFLNKAEPPYSFFSRSDDHFAQILPYDFASKYNRRLIRKIKIEKAFNLVQLNRLRFPNFLPDRLPQLPFPVPSLGSMFELIEDKTVFDAIEQAKIQSIDDRFVIENMVVMLYLESRDIPLKNCDVNDCNDKGMIRQFSLKVLLMPKQVADRIVQRELFYKKIKGEATQLPKLQIAKFNAAARDINSYYGLNQRYGQLVRDVIPPLSEAILNSYKLLYPILKNVYTENDQRRLFAAINPRLTQLLNTALDVRSHWGIQYVYSFVKDLIEAYNELRKAAIEWISECDANDRMFPKHILLGKIKLPSGRLIGNEVFDELLLDSGLVGGFNPEDLLDAYRQDFIPATQVQAHPHLKSKVISLHYRLYLMLSQFQGVGQELLRAELRVTPSKSGQYALSERAIPFYYDLAATKQHLLKNWSFQKVINREANEIYAYELAERSKRSLSFTLDDSDFYRVEGHLGKSYQTVIEKLEDWKKDYGLAMDVVAVNLGTRGSTISHKDFSFYFQDLEADFDVYKEELFCLLDKQAAYFENLELDVSAFSNNAAESTSLTNYNKFLPVTYKGNNVDFLAQVLETSPPSQVVASDNFALRTTNANATFSQSQVTNNTSLNFNVNASPATLKAYAIDSNASLVSKNIFTRTAKASRSNNELAFGNMYHKFKDPLFSGTITKRALIESIYSTKFEGLNPAIIDWAGLWSERTLSIIEQIDRVKEAITVDTIADFQFEEFQQKYNSLLKEILEYRDRIFNLGDSASVEELKIINYLDVLLNDCTIERFQSIVNEWLRRKDTLEQEFIFSNYLTKHPEMEHGGGVPKGGTLVLVYYDENSFQPVLPPLPVLPQPIPIPPLIPIRPLDISPAVLKENTKVALRKEENEKIETLLREETIRVQQEAVRKPESQTTTPDIRIANFRGINTLNVKENELNLKGLNLTIPTLAFQPNILVNPILPDRFYSIARGVVVADFYLPSRCCSDSPAVTYAFQAPEINFNFDQTVYCKNDSSIHTFSVNPAGGKIVGKIAGLIDNKDGSFSFKPSLLKVGDNKFGYEVKGIRKDVIIKVVQVFAGFELLKVEADEAAKSRILTITVRPIRFDADTGYQWSIQRLVKSGQGENIAPSNKSTHIFSVGFDTRTPAIKITLVASVGGESCTASSTQVFNYDKLLALKVRREKQQPQVDATRTLGKLDQAIDRDRYTKIPKDVLEGVKVFTGDFRDWLKEENVKDLIDGKRSSEIVTKVQEKIDEIKEQLGKEEIQKDPVALDEYVTLYDEVVKIGSVVTQVIDTTKLTTDKKEEINQFNNGVRADVLELEKNTGIVSSLSDKLTIPKVGITELVGTRTKVGGLAGEVFLGDVAKITDRKLGGN